MFNIDWDNIVTKVVDRLDERGKKTTIEKMTADLYVIGIEKGLSEKDAFESAVQKASFYEENLNGPKINRP